MVIVFGPFRGLWRVHSYWQKWVMPMFRTGVVFAIAATACAAEDSAEVALVKDLFRGLQPISVSENVEFCGYVGFDGTGLLRASTPVRGGADWCEPVWPEDLEVTASYHTHAGYDPDSWSEIPSGDDMESDEAEGIDGYVSTPGGRLWYIDTEDMVTFQLCGIGCLPQDPRFRPEPADRIRQSYTYDEIVEKIDG
ncbi:MAG: DUF4329 domain-containing protein [Pseudomonadota bacterium]